MKPPPKDWPRLSISVACEDPRAEIAWLQKAFGFEVRIVVDGEGGKVEHSELTFGGAMIMVSGTGKDGGVSPKKAGGHTAGVFLYVDDADAHCARAREAGATIIRELATNDYGEDYWCDRSYGCTDPEGHLWYFAHRVR